MPKFVHPPHPVRFALLVASGIYFLSAGPIIPLNGLHPTLTNRRTREAFVRAKTNRLPNDILSFDKAVSFTTFGIINGYITNIG